jgi:AraC-like DNA-binding protein
MSSACVVAPPAAGLRSFISHYAGIRLRDVIPGIDVGLPSRHAHLIISLESPIEMLQMPGRTQRGCRLRALVSGLHDAPAAIRRGGDLEIVHVFLRPAGLRTILHASPTELRSHVVDLCDLWGRSAESLIQQLREAPTWPLRFAVLDDAFVRALVPVQRQAAVDWAWQQLAARHGCVSIGQMARGIGWTRRHFTDRFRAELGVGPKTAARIFRFERACRLIKDARLPLVDVAAACGYYDQPHMTREWTALAGCTPRTWIANELPFLQDYELSGGDHGDRHGIETTSLDHV